jgi:hypothetical protein
MDDNKTENNSENGAENENYQDKIANHKAVNTGSLPTLTLLEVGPIIKLKDIAAIKGWLKKHNVQIHKYSKVNYVYQIEVDVEIDKVYARNLRVKFPNNWQEIYKKVSKDCSVYDMVVISLGGETYGKANSKVQLRNKKEEDLFKRYSA